MSFWVSIPFIFFVVILLWMAMYSYDKKRRRALAMMESTSPVITVTPATNSNGQPYSRNPQTVIYTIPSGYTNAHNLHQSNQVTIIPGASSSNGIHAHQQSGVAYVYPHKYEDLPPSYDQINTPATPGYPNAPPPPNTHSSVC